MFYNIKQRTLFYMIIGCQRIKIEECLPKNINRRVILQR
jgi:hypothetical protein